MNQRFAGSSETGQYAMEYYTEYMTLARAVEIPVTGNVRVVLVLSRWNDRR